MSAESITNGASGTDTMSAAQKLMQQHGGDESHNPTVEEVPDEDQVQHPAPSAHHEAPTEDATAAPSPSQPMSAKAAGKQKAAEQPSKNAGINMQSEELFPALGAPKGPPPAAPNMWAKKPAAVGKAGGGMTNGTNGTHASSNSASRTSTPSGPMSPSSAPARRGPVPQMSIPGRYSEQISLHPSQLTPRNQLKKPVQDVLRDINKRSKATVEMKAGPGGTVVFEGTGPVDAVRIALKEVATQLCAKVCDGLLRWGGTKLTYNRTRRLCRSPSRSEAVSSESKVPPSRQSPRRLAHAST